MIAAMFAGMFDWLLALPAPTESAPDGGGGTAGASQWLLPMVAVMVIVMLLPMLGQKKEKRRRKRVLELKKHDRVVTTGGIFGTLVNIDETTVTLEIGKDMRMKMKRSSIFDLEDGDKIEAELAASKGKKPVPAKAKA